MPTRSRNPGSLLRRPAARDRAVPSVPALRRPDWMSDEEFRVLDQAYATALAERGTVVPVQEIRSEFDLDSFVRPPWMSPEAFRRFKRARAQLLSGGGRELTVDGLRAEFGLEPG